MIKKTLMLTTLLAGALGAGWVAAQPTTPAAAPAAGKAAEAAPAKPGTPGMGMRGGRRGPHGPGMGPGGGMGMGAGMEGMCPMMVGNDTKVEVKNLPKGVTITLTNDKPDVVTRLQKAAEGMRLMHEAHAK